MRALGKFKFVYLHDSGDGNQRRRDEGKETVLDRGLKIDYNDYNKTFSLR